MRFVRIVFCDCSYPSSLIVVVVVLVVVRVVVRVVGVCVFSVLFGDYVCFDVASAYMLKRDDE